MLILSQVLPDTPATLALHWHKSFISDFWIRCASSNTMCSAGFIGELRVYQKEALGWFEFLQKFVAEPTNETEAKIVKQLAEYEKRRGEL